MRALCRIFTALEVEAISAVSSSPVQRSTHSSTSTAPPASMTSATEDEPTSIAMPQRQQQQQQPVYEPQPANSHPTKSCLSRHNSTHQSIKKKVNISNRAEIIEPDPLNTSLLIHANHNNNNNSSLVDDDDVFSDSLPPPKRESMCAPYIEGELLPETLAFAHGLPAWFDDERLNEMYAFSIVLAINT